MVVQAATSDESARRRSAEFERVCADEQAFRMWYEAALPRVYGFAYWRTGGDTDLAQEIAQQAFVAAIRSRSGFDGRSDAVVWICSIARNLMVDHRRRVARDARRHLSLVVREIAVDGDARAWAQVDEGEELASALRQLSADERIAVVLRYHDNLPVREIARHVGRTEAATESLLSRGRRRLRVILRVPD